MTVYAVFLCMAVTGQCQSADPAYVNIMGYPTGGTVYRSMADCQAALPRDFHPHGAHLVCLSRHVEAWR
jgi:hypothetical protein